MQSYYLPHINLCYFVHRIRSFDGEEVGTLCEFIYNYSYEILFAWYFWKTNDKILSYLILFSHGNFELLKLPN
jgi:hypothetical protein